jgi:hypothetical protein
MAEEREKRAADYDRASLDRRQFVKVGTTSLGVAGLGVCVFGFRYLSPNVLYEPPPIVSVGRPERYAVGSVTLDARFGIFVARVQEGFYALSAWATAPEPLERLRHACIVASLLAVPLTDLTMLSCSVARSSRIVFAACSSNLSQSS